MKDICADCAYNSISMFIYILTYVSRRMHVNANDVTDSRLGNILYPDLDLEDHHSFEDSRKDIWIRRIDPNGRCRINPIVGMYVLMRYMMKSYMLSLDLVRLNYTSFMTWSKTDVIQSIRCKKKQWEIVVELVKSIGVIN